MLGVSFLSHHVPLSPSLSFYADVVTYGGHLDISREGLATEKDQAHD